MSKILYRTHSRAPERGTLWENPGNGRIYRITKTKWYGAVGQVHGKAATLATAGADLNDALTELGNKVSDAFGIWRLKKLLRNIR